MRVVARGGNSDRSLLLRWSRDLRRCLEKKILETSARKHTTERTELILPNCHDSRRGTEPIGDEADEGLLSPSGIATFLEKESILARPSLTSAALKPKIRVSRLDSCSVFSRRSAICIASRAEGDGGRGAGSMA